MAKLTLNSIGSRYGSIDALNDNFDAIEQAFENTLSLDGTSPNAMEADLDMNSNDILNTGTVYAASVQTSQLFLGGVPVEIGLNTSTATVVTFEFIATANQSSYDLAILTPISAASVMVTVNGFTLSPTSISVTGSVISFLPLQAGDEVVIRLYTRDIGGAPTVVLAGYTTYAFTATAGQSTLSTAPYAIPVSSLVMMFVNGIKLKAADVSVSSTNINFPALEVDDEVEIIEVKAQ
jgi:hypothetical protein